jgi:hypothetical protein
MSKRDKARLDVLLGIIRGGQGFVPAAWINRDGALTGINVRTRRDIDVCIAAMKAERAKR